MQAQKPRALARAHEAAAAAEMARVVGKGGVSKNMVASLNASLNEGRVCWL